MRIAHTKDKATMRLKAYLESQNIECFLPMKIQTEVIDGRRIIHKVPAINSLIFIHLEQDKLTELKRTRTELASLRYYMHHYPGRPSEIITIPDKQMENFMRAVSVDDSRIMFLGNQDFSKKIGRPVRVVDGPFKGVEGIVCRVKKDRRVIVYLKDILTVALSCISPDLLEEIK